MATALRKLTTTDEELAHMTLMGRSLPATPKDARMSDSLGLPPQVSGVQYAQLGGIYGHFFNDLQPEVRAMVLER